MPNVIFRFLIWIQKCELFSSFRVRILKIAGICIGKNSSIGSNVSILTNLLELGDNVRIGSGSRIDNFAKVSLGEWVRLGPEVLIETATHKTTTYGVFRRQPDDEEFKPVIIERGCMIYARATILPGITIREGCVIAAGCIINRDTQSNGLYIGDRPKQPIKIYSNHPTDE